MAQVVEHLPTKCKALSSNTSPKKKKKQKNMKQHILIISCFLWSSSKLSHVVISHHGNWLLQKESSKRVFYRESATFFIIWYQKWHSIGSTGFICLSDKEWISTSHPPQRERIMPDRTLRSQISLWSMWEGSD
jgi:hypothetical protein